MRKLSQLNLADHAEEIADLTDLALDIALDKELVARLMGIYSATLPTTDEEGNTVPVSNAAFMGAVLANVRPVVSVLMRDKLDTLLGFVSVLADKPLDDVRRQPAVKTVAMAMQIFKDPDLKDFFISAADVAATEN